MHETCCPQYTIRLDVSRFKHNKSQRQLHNRLRRYLNGDHTTPTTSSIESGRRKSDGQGILPAAAASTHESGNGRKAGKGGGESSKERNNDDQRRDSPSLIELSSARVATAAIAAVEDGVLNGVELIPEWRSDVEGWSRVSAEIKLGEVYRFYSF